MKWMWLVVKSQFKHKLIDIPCICSVNRCLAIAKFELKLLKINAELYEEKCALVAYFEKIIF